MKSDTKTPPKLPERSFFSVEELAKQWGCSAETVESYVYDHKILRLAVQSQYVQEFHGKSRISCKLLSTMEDISSLYKGLTEEIGIKEELDLNFSYPDGPKISEFYGGSVWDSPPPRLMYLNVKNVEVVERGADILATDTLRLRKDDELIFRTFETFSGIRFGVFENSSETPIGISAEELVVSAQERDRFVAQYSSKPSVVDVDSISEEEKLKMIIGAATQLLMTAEGHSFFSEDDSDDARNKKIADYVLKWIEKKEDGGLTVRNLKAEIKKGLALISKD